MRRGVHSLGSLYSLALWYLEGSLYSVFLDSIDFLYISSSSLTHCVINYSFIGFSAGELLQLALVEPLRREKVPEEGAGADGEDWCR